MHPHSARLRRPWARTPSVMRQSRGEFVMGTEQPPPSVPRGFLQVRLRVHLAFTAQWRRFHWTTSKKRGWGSPAHHDRHGRSGRNAASSSATSRTARSSRARVKVGEGHPLVVAQPEAHPMPSPLARPIAGRCGTPGRWGERNRLWQRWARSNRSSTLRRPRSTETPVIRPRTARRDRLNHREDACLRLESTPTYVGAGQAADALLSRSAVNWRSR